MTINREAIEQHLSERMAVAAPEHRPDEAFVRDAVDLFCKAFEACGWPSEMPDFTVLPPRKENPKGFLGDEDGYAGYHLNGEAALWRKRAGATDWDTSVA